MSLVGGGTEVGRSLMPGERGGRERERERKKIEREGKREAREVLEIGPRKFLYSLVYTSSLLWKLAPPRSSGTM